MWQRVDVHPILVLTYRLYTGVPGLQSVDRGLRAHLRRGCEPVGGANFLTPRSVILSFYSAVDDGPREAAELEVPNLYIFEHAAAVWYAH
jgi:hypothetical protein